MVLQTVQTPGWVILMRRFQEDVDEAQAAIMEAPYASDVVMAGLTRRWQQRNAVFLSLKQYIGSLESERDTLLENAKLAEGSVPLEDAERYQEVG